MLISRRTFLKCMGATATATALAGCSAEDILGGGTNSAGSEPAKGSTADMQTLLQSFIEVAVQNDIRDACFMDPNALQVGNHVINFPCTLDKFIEITGFSTQNNLDQLLSSGESVAVTGVLDGSEYSLTCSAKTTDNSATALHSSLVEKDTIASTRYGYKAFIYPAGVRPSFTTAQDLQKVFGNPSYVITDATDDMSEEDKSDVSKSNLIYEYFLSVIGRGAGESYLNEDKKQELGVKYYIDRNSGMVTKVRFSEELEYIAQGDIAINGYGKIATVGIMVPMMNNLETTEDVDGRVVIWKPYNEAGKYYSIEVFTDGGLLYDLDGTDAVGTEGWSERIHERIDAANAGTASEATATGEQIDVTSETTTDAAMAAQYMEDLATLPEDVALLRADGYTVVTNDVGYVGFKKVADDKNHAAYAYYCNTDIHENNHQNNGIVYLETRRAQRTYGASDSARLNDSNVASSFATLAQDFAIQMLKLNS